MVDIIDEDRELFDNRRTVFDRIEQEVDEEDSARPIREAFESATDNVPSGPGGKLGDGDLVGYAGLFAVRTGQIAVLPLPGVRQPGFQVVSHGVDTEPEEFDRHTININAASLNVARVAAEYIVAAPSNIDYITGEIDTVSVEEKTQRSTFSTWELVVDVADRGQKEI